MSQDVPYPQQLERKRLALGAQLRAVLGGLTPDVRPLVAMPTGEDGMPWRFRHKAAFVFGPDRTNPQDPHHGALRRGIAADRSR